MSRSRSVQALLDLIESFVEGRISAAEFERRYMLEFQARDDGTWREEEYQLLNGLFGAVDAFCADPRLRDPRQDLDETGLRAAARRVLEQLPRTRPASSFGQARPA